MAANQRSFMYIPLPGPTTPQQAGLQHFNRQTLATADDTTITYWESARHQNAPTLLYFHGNTGGLSRFAPMLRELDALGFHVVAMEYRGFSDAPGRPSQNALVKDGAALLAHLRATRKQKLVIWGYSIGSGVGSQVAATNPPDALVLEAPFTTMLDRVRQMFPFLPVRHLLHDTYMSRDALKTLHMPLLIIHGTSDRVVPVSHGKALYDAVNAPKELRIYEGFNHVNLWKSGAYKDAAAFIKKH